MTTNTHIAAQARQRAESLESTSGCTDADQVSIELAAEALCQCAQALEAAPALDAQGERPSWRDMAYVQLGRMRDKMAPEHVDAVQRFLRDEFAPPPPAVGKPLSEEQIAEARKWLYRNHDIVMSANTIRELVGIVTKETGT